MYQYKGIKIYPTSILNVTDEYVINLLKNNEYLFTYIVLTPYRYSHLGKISLTEDGIKHLKFDEIVDSKIIFLPDDIYVGKTIKKKYFKTKYNFIYYDNREDFMYEYNINRSWAISSDTTEDYNTVRCLINRKINVYKQAALCFFILNRNNCGVYAFINRKDKKIRIGESKNIINRLTSHTVKHKKYFYNKLYDFIILENVEDVTKLKEYENKYCMLYKNIGYEILNKDYHITC